MVVFCFFVCFAFAGDFCFAAGLVGEVAYAVAEWLFGGFRVGYIDGWGGEEEDAAIFVAFELVADFWGDTGVG